MPKAASQDKAMQIAEAIARLNDAFVAAGLEPPTAITLSGYDQADRATRLIYEYIERMGYNTTARAARPGRPRDPHKIGEIMGVDIRLQAYSPRTV